MGDTTDELLSLAAAITDEPEPRELDMLLATGEHQSATLMSMALHALGVPAISADRRPGRHRHRRHLRPGAHRRDRPRPDPRRDGRRQGRHRGRLPGPERDGARADGDHDPGSRRLRHDGGRPRRRPARRPLPDLHRREGHLHGRPAPGPRRAPALRHRLRGDAGAGPPGRPGDAGPGRRARLGQRRRHRGPQLVRGRPRHPDQGGPARGAAQQGAGHRPATGTSPRSPSSRSPTGPASPTRSSPRWPTAASSST